jgi:ribosomal protein S18 acetylase RimI-like enzyme
MGVTLARVEALDLETSPGLARALADGIERNHEGPPPSFPPGSERYLVRAGGDVAGVLVLRRDCPADGTAAVLAIAIDPARRGRAIGVKALLVAERRLARDGQGRVIARVPRTNGRGLYFMLRAGYTPLATDETPHETGDATWFGRKAT